MMNLYKEIKFQRQRLRSSMTPLHIVQNQQPRLFSSLSESSVVITSRNDRVIMVNCALIGSDAVSSYGQSCHVMSCDVMSCQRHAIPCFLRRPSSLRDFLSAETSRSLGRCLQPTPTT